MLLLAGWVLLLLMPLRLVLPDSAVIHSWRLAKLLLEKPNEIGILLS